MSSAAERDEQAYDEPGEQKRDCSSVGKLGADEMHENLCKCHLEFFDAWLKKAKPRLELASNDVVTVTEYAPDIS